MNNINNTDAVIEPLTLDEVQQFKDWFSSRQELPFGLTESGEQVYLWGDTDKFSALAITFPRMLLLVDNLLEELQTANEKIVELEGQQILSTASINGAMSMLIDVRDECVVYRKALMPFSRAYSQVPNGLRTVLRIWNGEIEEESDYITLPVSTDDLERAHLMIITDGKG